MALTVLTNTLCGFCGNGDHEKCSIGVKHQGRHERFPLGIVWACRCTDGGCREGRRKCADCNNRNTNEVNPETWTCIDSDTCRAVVETKRENSPFLAQLREIKETVAMAKIENDKTKAEKVAKTKEPTFCLVTGEPTKGGLFKPGMDARYVSERVIEVENAKFSAKAKASALAKMKKDGVSEKLVAKFEKSVGLAEAKATAKAEAAAAKEAAKAEKAEKASA
jgi:hypothetical protein